MRERETALLINENFHMAAPHCTATVLTEVAQLQKRQLVVAVRSKSLKCSLIWTSYQRLKVDRERARFLLWAVAVQNLKKSAYFLILTTGAESAGMPQNSSQN
ncbi:MAG: hypothetical protein MJE68_01490 [Proteobacteria bacterium]|nr:hypothetical protein [Pseudomonadota bacterium]